MKKITVHSSKEYEIRIGNGLLHSCGKSIKEISNAGKVCLVSDDTVFDLYGDIVKGSLESAGFEVIVFVFLHGEESKNLEVYGKLLNTLCANKFTRSDILVSLGGGVTGDLAGFAAATFQRGIDFVQIPTTLLAAVDSSVGGKTGVDLPMGKNQVGAFHQPILVICDPVTLNTLPSEQYSCGAAEVIKYGMIGNKDLLNFLKNNEIRDNYEDVIATCVDMKRMFVEEDEFDTGLRMMLNFGHTIGHAIEILSDFRILHGQGVAAGMQIITRACVARGICGPSVEEELNDILRKYDLIIPVRFGASELADIVAVDKKNTGDKTNLIVPVELGKCEILSVLTKQVEGFIVDGGIS